MSNLLEGISDSLNILAFKWRTVRPKKQRVWIIFAGMFAMGVVLLAAYGGTAFRTLITASTTNSEGSLSSTLLLWINIFLTNNASLAAGGILWALIASVVLIPLVGYSFTSIIPEGDLASIKITDNHKIADSIFLQFVSSISFVQIIALTGLASILTIGSDTPGIAIVFSWMLWVLSVLATVLAAWSFEFLHRKFGIKAKFLSFTTVAIIVGILYLLFSTSFVGFFGIGEKWTSFLQSLSFQNLGIVFEGILIFVLLFIGLNWVIGITATYTLELPKRIKKKDTTKILSARLGLAGKIKLNNITQFLANMIFRQNNIWKPLLLSISFATTMALVFFAFYQVLFTVSTLLPMMISLVWSVNIFGILGSGTTWLVSLPQGKKQLLGSIMLIQYIIVGVITFIIMGLIAIIYHPDIMVFIQFLLATIGTSVVITQFSINKAVNFPYRYRVHIRGESILPPNKAFSYMAKLFVIGFTTSGIIYSIGFIPFNRYGFPEAIAPFAQMLLILIIIMIARIRFVTLRRRWMYESDVLQNIIKTVGS